jgi:large subunit ribosomal protein L6
MILVRFYKIIRIGWVGYRASNQGQKLDLALGFSHNIVLKLLWSNFETISEKVKPNCKLTFDKQL